MSTVRIYKVAELLNTSSQEVLALLKRAHGIELKSASSTLEEVVARSFVERVARQRNIALPGGDMRADIVAFDGWNVEIALTCSAGFYVRSFAHDLGKAVGTGAYLTALQRTRSGEFRLDEAMSLDSLLGDADGPGAREGSRETLTDWLFPMEKLLQGFPAVVVAEEGRVWVGHGRELGPGQYQLSTPESQSTTPEATWVRVFDSHGHLLALATAGNSPGSLHPAVVLN